MKNNTTNFREYSKDWYEAFGQEDTRYYGIFLRREKEEQYILVDPKRFKRIFRISEEMKRVMDKRKGTLFQPSKKRISDYNINIINQDIQLIRKEWNTTQKPFIKKILSEIKPVDFNPWDDDLFQCGIVDYEEANTNALMMTALSQNYAKFRGTTLFCSLYAQYFHQLAAQFDAMILKTLTRNGYEGDKYNRNVLYAFKGNKQEKIVNLDGFNEYNKMYIIWNFIKHNSLSTYKSVKDNFPELLIDGKYTQGELACSFIKFTDELIDSIFEGMERFLREYCRLVFGEDGST
ncbi:MAG TPA: hypothetical protein PK771_00865 [Spirochaetota bacterium]|nr:hypothetical protein [Spirochaetota bacterium]